MAHRMAYRKAEKKIEATLRLVLAAVTMCVLVPTALADEFAAVEHARRTIYHSSQKPGFTSWVGAWTMPDGSLMISFTPATRGRN